MSYIPMDRIMTIKIIGLGLIVNMVKYIKTAVGIPLMKLRVTHTFGDQQETNK